MRLARTKAAAGTLLIKRRDQIIKLLGNLCLYRSLSVDLSDFLGD